jgi:ATP-dependent DNA ligase
MNNPTVERIKLRFIEPMYALAANGLPESSEWIYEVKLDGYRCLAGRDSTSVTLWSRRGNVFTLQFRGLHAPANSSSAIFEGVQLNFC